MLQQCLSEALNEACRQNVLEARRQKQYYDQRSGTVVLKPGDVVLLKMDSYTGRRKTKNKWSYENYMVLHQLGLDILTYEIQAEGGLTCIVHWNQLFLLLPKEEDDNCMPLVAALWVEIMDSLGQSPGYAPLEADMIPEEYVRMLEVVDMHGLGYTCPQTQQDLVTPGLPDPEEGHVASRSIPASHSILSSLPSSPLTGGMGISASSSRSTIKFGQAVIQPITHMPPARLHLLQ